MIEARAIVFPCDRAGQFHELFFIETGFQFFHHRIRNLNGRFRHRHGVADAALLDIRETLRVLEFGQCLDSLAPGMGPFRESESGSGEDLPVDSDPARTFPRITSVSGWVERRGTRH